MMKKYLAVLLSGAMLLGAVSMTGCGSSSSSGSGDAAKEETASDSGDSEEASGGGGDNLAESKDMLTSAIDSVMTTDNHKMMDAGSTFDVPEAEGTAEELDKLDDSDSAKWHFYEYLDWDEAEDAEFPASPADGQNGKHVILIVHGAHAWTTCYQEAFEQACDAVGMTVDVYDPNWDQSTQDGYVDQAINEAPDAIVVIPVSADHAAQQFKKITSAGIPAFCSNTLPEADAMNFILAYTGPNDWYQMRNLADNLGEQLGGEGGVCYITHNVGTSPYYARTFGPMSELADKYPNIKSLDYQSPGFEAAAVKQVVSDWITKYGDDLNAIVLADDSDQAIGATEACEAAGRDDIIIVAAGISKQGAELIQGGKMYGASYQSCQADAGLAVRTVSEYFNGEDIARVSYIGTDIITKDNVEDFLPCQW
ncbi:MAG: sugar ABC transporter substrate-binding protein [Lachnospiraceae bacterium]|jgi:ABC-type sugar transport system substrate-binding protein|nr:sugar ABC transporter substrate-binding protein [Lachnospiraceae bacterium]MDD3615285.1 sugar ABC transporter substrate-binding protein [Lachnospiraceae bacterium]